MTRNGDDLMERLLAALRQLVHELDEPDCVAIDIDFDTHGNIVVRFMQRCPVHKL